QKRLPRPKTPIHRVFHTGVYLSTGLWVRVLYQPRDIPSNLANKCPSMYLSPSLPIPNSLMNWSLSSLDLKHTANQNSLSPTFSIRLFSLACLAWNASSKAVSSLPTSSLRSPVYSMSSKGSSAFSLFWSGAKLIFLLKSTCFTVVLSGRIEIVQAPLVGTNLESSGSPPERSLRWV